MKRTLAKGLAAGTAAFALASMATAASADPVELPLSALDAVTAGASANSTAGAVALGTSSTTSTRATTRAVQLPRAAAVAATAGATAGAANAGGTAEAAVTVTYGVNGEQTTVSRSDSGGSLAAVLVARLTADLVVQ